MLTTIINWNFVSVGCGKHSQCQNQGSEEHRDLKYSDKKIFTAEVEVLVGEGDVLVQKAAS
jgi:hypothetical protein